MRITVKKARMIEQIVDAGCVFRSSYGYKLNDSGEIEKFHLGSSKREVYVTAEEVKAVMSSRKYIIY